MGNEIVERLRDIASLRGPMAGSVIPLTCIEAADEIERLRNALAEQTILHEVQKTNTLNEVERLRKDKRELLEIAALFADYGKCQAADEYGDCIHIDGVCEWHSAEHLWESFCMSRGI